MIKSKYRFVCDNFKLGGYPLSTEILEMEPLAVANSIQLQWARAEDFIIFDGHGNQWIDMTSGIFVTNAGHANQMVKEAIRRELDSSLLFSYNYPTDVKHRFLKKLLEISPRHFNRVALLMTGSETVDLAYKLIKFWARKNNRRKIVVMRGSYHGRGLANDLICGHPDKANWSGVVDPDVVFIDFPYDECDFSSADLPPAEEIAAFFLETFQGWGAWLYPKNYIKGLSEYARKIGALVCFDEMQAGFYRMGTLYGYMTYGNEIEPDIICLGKGISSSLPIAALLSRRDIVDIELGADLHGTHSGNPLCCAAALANLEFLTDPGFQQQLKGRIKVFEEEVKSLESIGSVCRVNVCGMIAGIIFASTQMATSIVKSCIERGVLTVCTNKNSIKLAPPLTITEDAIKEAFCVIRDVIYELAQKKID